MSVRSSTGALAPALSALVTTAILGVTHAQSPLPDAGSLLREAPRALPRGLPDGPQGEATPGAATQGEVDAPRVRVTAFVIEGALALPEDTLQARLADQLGRELTVPQLLAAAERLTIAYRAAGLLARVVLPPQDLTDGRVRLVVVEGRVGEVRLLPEGTPRLRLSVAEGYLSRRARPGDPVRPDDLQRAVTLINDLPGVQASGVLAPGERPGESRLDVRLADGPRVSGLVQLDDQGARATGTARLVASAALNNTTGRGDQLTATALVSEGTRFARLGGTLPVGRDGWRVGANASALTYELRGALRGVADGEASTLGLVASYPLVRSEARNLALTLNFDARRFENRSFAVQTSDKRLRTGTATLSGDALDARGGGGLTQFSLGLVAGRLDLSRNADDLSQDAAGPDRQGDYRKLAWSLGRLQRVTTGVILLAQASGQLASRNLDSAERFSLGGANGVRAYPTLEGSGDAGALLTVEMRADLPVTGWQAFAGLDAGRIRVNQRNWNGWNAARPDLPGGYTLAGAAAGVAWSQRGWSVRATVANPIGRNPLRDASGNDGDGRHGVRGWLTVVVTL